MFLWGRDFVLHSVCGITSMYASMEMINYNIVRNESANTSKLMQKKLSGSFKRKDKLHLFKNQVAHF